jgi:hypothetical protein
MILRLALVFIAISSAQAAPFSLGDLEKILAAKSLKTMEQALPFLPQEFRKNAVLMAHSRSLQSGSPDAPRAILSNEDGSFVLAFGRSGDSFEMVQFHRKTRRFEFAEIAFDGKNGATVEHDLTRCSGCHGSSDDSHPVFQSFARWPGAYGENAEKLAGPERVDLAAFLKAAATDPRYGALVDLHQTHGTLDSEGRLAGRPNSEFLRKMMRLNFERIADRVVTGKEYTQNRYAMLASIYCVKEKNFAKDFLAGLGDVPDEILGLEENANPNRSSAIAFYWQLYKRGYSPFNWSLSFGDNMNADGARMPEPNAEYGTSAQELARAFAERDTPIAAIVGTDGRTTPSCTDLAKRVNSR